MRIFMSTLLIALLILPSAHPRSPVVPLVATGAVVATASLAGIAICHYKRRQIISKLIQRDQIRTINGYQMLCLVSTLLGVSLCSLGAVIHGTANKAEQPQDDSCDEQLLSPPVQQSPTAHTPPIIVTTPTPIPPPKNQQDPTPPPAKPITQTPQAPSSIPAESDASISAPQSTLSTDAPLSAKRSEEGSPSPHRSPVKDNQATPTPSPKILQDTSPLSIQNPGSNRNPSYFSPKLPHSSSSSQLETDHNPVPPLKAPTSVKTIPHFPLPDKEKTPNTPLLESERKITPRYEDDPVGLLVKRRDDLTTQQNELQKIADLWDLTSQDINEYEALLTQIASMTNLITRCNKQIKSIQENPPSPSNGPTPNTDELISSLDTYLTTSAKQINTHSRVHPSSPIPFRPFDSPQPGTPHPPTHPPGAPTTMKTHPIFGDRAYAPPAPQVEQPPAEDI